ncbi:tetraspanin [Elysia marginata]|uniref:Tetraspanin n=1 Tax=Elysia marginata TaxID=1093978 RepID=A0AAV4J423_9GAST|nr:tetraspanin [Elysia marginata]
MSSTWTRRMARTSASTCLTASLGFIIFAFFVRFSFGSYISYQLQSLPGYDTYRKVTRDPRPEYDFHLYSRINELGDFIIAVNVLYIGCMVVYVTYFSHRNPLTLPGTATVTSLLFLLEGAFANILYNPGILRDEKTVGRLQTRLHTEYKVFSTNEFSVIQDHLSIWLQCCGIVDVYDFHNVTLNLQGKTSLQVPPSCCKRHVFEEGLTAVVECMKKGDEKSTHRRGCMDAYMDWIQDVCHAYVIYIWIHLIDCVIHAALYKRKIAFANQIAADSHG